MSDANLESPPHAQPTKVTKYLMGHGLGLLILVLLLTGCNPQMPKPSNQPSRIQTTISADGEMIAALDWPLPHRVPRLRIKRLLPQESPWQELPISPYISSIYFGMTGKQLLLTEVTDETLRSVLVSWDMDKPDSPPTLLYEGYRLDFPTEFKPGHYLVRSCNNERADWPCTKRVFNDQWEWVHKSQQMQVFNDREKALLYHQPIIVGERGFFWFHTFRQDAKNSPFVTLAFKDQQLDEPDIAYDETVTGIKCDRALERCLIRYEKGTNIERRIFGGSRVAYGGQTCEIPELTGYVDTFFITPDGRAAVFAWSNTDQPSRLIVIRFKPGQCAPDSVQHHPFEEKST